MNNYFVCASPYHVYLSLLLIKKHHINNVKFYLTTNDPPNEKFFESIKSNLEKITVVEDVIIRKRSVPLDLLMIEKIKDYLTIKSLKVSSEDNVYLFPWNTHTLISLSNFWYQYADNIILVEEGTTIHLYPKPSELSLKVKRMFYGFDEQFMHSNKIKKILVQYPHNFPMFPEEKLMTLPLQNWIDSLTTEDKKEIIRVFSNEALKDAIEHLHNKSRAIIILTQPLSEDNYMTEREKIERYQKIVDEYQSSYQVFLKRHPRELTTYHFDNVIELAGSFPSELLELIDIEFDYAIGICTSAIDQIKAKHKFNTEPSFLKDFNK